MAPVALVAIGIAGCGGTPGEDKPNQSSEPEAKVQTDGFEKLGNVTLDVVSSETGAGPKKAVRELSRGFEQKYPNVDVKVSYRPFETWIKQVKLELSGDNPPDVVPGNQGYQVDGDLVKAGLIMPMDKYSDAYGWAESFSPESLQQFTWSEDGRTFGEGTLWGIAQSGQSTGVFANKEKMQAAGVDPAALKTFADFEGALETLKGKASGNEPVIMLGNKEQYPLLHLWGMIQQAYTPAQQVRDWIFHKQGATFDTPGNRQALERLKAWSDAGYFGTPDSFNGRAEQDAANLFGRGQGTFMLGGNWNAQTALDGLQDNATFFDMGPGESGKRGAIGSTSVPLHISAKSKQADLAAAYIDFTAGRPASKALVDTTQVPAVLNPTAEPSGGLASEVTDGWQSLVDDGGLMFYHDWSSPTMLETIGQSFQELVVGRASVDEVVTRIQTDWEEYDKELKAAS